MSYVDDFNLDDYETIDELSEVRADIQMEISALNGYLRGIGEKILAIEDALGNNGAGTGMAEVR